MWKQLAEWCAAIVLTAAVGAAAFGAAAWAQHRNEKAAETAAGAFTIVVDAGHGGFDGGATGAETGVCEAGLNLTVAKLVAAKLEAGGMSVRMTRDSEEALGKNKQKDMAARKAIFREKDVDLVVSIHMNKFTDPSVSGAMAYYMAGSAEGQKLAQTVIDRVCTAIERPQRLANPGDYFVIRECACPAVLVECGFLSNAGDEKLLCDPGHQEKLASAISAGVLAYLDSVTA